MSSLEGAAWGVLRTGFRGLDRPLDHGVGEREDEDGVYLLAQQSAAAFCLWRLALVLGWHFFAIGEWDRDSIFKLVHFSFGSLCFLSCRPDRIGIASTVHYHTYLSKYLLILHKLEN